MARGRPRKYDEDKALSAAMLLFWEQGLSATSLDDLAAAMQMNRPSIYNAFGNKDDIYRKALAKFCGQLDAGLEEILEDDRSLRESLVSFYESALEVYCGTDPAMGCLMICTAPSEALLHPEVGSDLKALIERVDLAFTKRLKRAHEEGELPDHVEPDIAASLLQATLQTLALRARTGTPKRRLKKLSAYAVDRLIT